MLNNNEKRKREGTMTPVNYFVSHLTSSIKI